MRRYVESLLNWLDLRRRRSKGWVEINLLGFTSHRWRTIRSMRWAEVHQIGVGRKAAGIVETFYAVLAGEQESIVVDDLDAGFEDFQAAIFENWPEIKKEWLRVFAGLPDRDEYVVLWKSQERY